MQLKLCLTCNKLTEHTDDNFCIQCGRLYDISDLHERIFELSDIVEEQFDTIDMLSNALQKTDFILGTIQALSYHSDQSVN